VSLDGSELVKPGLRAGLRPEIAVDRLAVIHEDHLAVIHEDHLAVIHEDRLEVIQEAPRLLAGSAILVGSSGGHLAQLLSIAPLWAKDKRSYVTFDTVDALSLLADEQVTWAHHPTTRNLRNLMRNTRLAFREVRRRRPDVVVSTGAAVAFPFFIAARLRGIPTVYIEVYDRIDSPTLTGRLCRPLSTLFCVQWPEQLEFYRGSKLVGSLM
jgi:UDP-N-acetylglucosamine:LPS N-acetylglucosamine transferase